MLALGVGAGPVGDDSGLNADLTTMLGLVENDDGTVTYCDASGHVWRRQPVAKWIAFTVARLFHQMQKETARQLGDPSLDDDARVSLARKLRRELRADALGIAFLRHGRAFELADAHEAEAYASPIPVPALPGHGTVSPDLLWATEEHREAVHLMLSDPLGDDRRTEAHVERIDRLAQVLRDLPARSLADLQHKMLYLWPGSLEGAEIGDALAATFGSFRKDVDGLIGAAVSPQPSNPPSTAVSPTLTALVEDWSALVEQINAPGASDEDVERVGARLDAAQNAIYEFPAASAADLLAKVPVFRDELYDATSGLSEGHESSDTFVGRAWLGLFRDFERLAAAPVASPSLADRIIVGWREWAARPDLDETEAGEAEFERLSNLRYALIDAAEMLPPTIENLRAKALALAWVTYVDLWQHGRARSEYGTDGQLMLDIDTAICGRLKTHYARAEA